MVAIHGTRNDSFFFRVVRSRRQPKRSPRLIYKETGCWTMLHDTSLSREESTPTAKSKQVFSEEHGNWISWGGSQCHDHWSWKNKWHPRRPLEGHVHLLHQWWCSPSLTTLSRKELLSFGNDSYEEAKSEVVLDPLWSLDFDKMDKLTKIILTCDFIFIPGQLMKCVGCDDNSVQCRYSPSFDGFLDDK